MYRYTIHPSVSAHLWYLHYGTARTAAIFCLLTQMCVTAWVVCLLHWLLQWSEGAELSGCSPTNTDATSSDWYYGSTGVDGVWTIGRREDYLEECACSGEQNQFSVLDFQRGLTFTHQLIWLINELCLTGGWVFLSVHPCLIESIRFKIFNPSPASPWSLVLL